jgi:branched-chain amino acid aminotransferase
MGMKVERRPVAFDELANFEECGACGTAAVISPVSKIVDIENDVTYKFGDGNPGPKSTELYNRLRAIQHGEAEDKFNWCTILDI